MTRAPALTGTGGQSDSWPDHVCMCDLLRPTLAPRTRCAGARRGRVAPDDTLRASRILTSRILMCHTPMQADELCPQPHSPA
jgi:hypothetical protein